jgi:hypothetical protein
LILEQLNKTKLTLLQSTPNADFMSETGIKPTGIVISSVNNLFLICRMELA